MSPDSRRRLVLAGVAAGGMLLSSVVGVLLLLPRSPAGPPPPLFPMPAFSLVDQSGMGFSSQALGGQIVIADFIFTRCPTICPALSARMGRLQKRLAGLPGVHLVSFTVDPEHDTPEVLRAYGQTFGQDPARWTFLTGDAAALRKAIEEGFKIGVRGEGVNLTHGNSLVLVDSHGQIRDYYDAGADDRLAADVAALGSGG